MFLGKRLEKLKENQCFWPSLRPWPAWLGPWPWFGIGLGPSPDPWPGPGPLWSGERAKPSSGGALRSVPSRSESATLYIQTPDQPPKGGSYSLQNMFWASPGRYLSTPGGGFRFGVLTNSKPPHISLSQTLNFGKSGQGPAGAPIRGPNPAQHCGRTTILK